MKIKFKTWLLWLIGMMLLLAGIILISLSIGTTFIPLSKILSLLTQNTAGTEYSILFNIRLPRILLGLAVGGALSVSGVLLQGLFRNPLVEPYTLGISGGAALGVCLNIVFRVHNILGVIAFPISGFIGAITVVLLIYIISLRRGIIKINGVLLTGVMISFISSAIIMLIMAVSRIEDLHGIVFWIMGSLDEPNWALIKLSLLISFAGLIASYYFCFSLNALSVGEEEAAHLGINVEKDKKYLFLLASLLTGLSVSVAGIIGFIGLVVPHFVRMFIGRDHRILLVSSYFFGASFLILCDTLARTIILPLELPVGVITGITGGVLFIFAITRKHTIGGGK